jgi:pimeloyl-ACP methyl ester carboxylesterase
MSIEPTERTIDIDGLALHYLEAGSGKPILFLHGAGGRPPQCASFVPMLAAQHRLLIPSRPGFDVSPIGECKTVADVVAVMANFIDRVVGAGVHVVAQSAGGAIGCWLAILRPDLVLSLVLSAPAAFAGHRPPPRREELEHILYGDTPAWSAAPTLSERQRIARNAQANMNRFPVPEGNVDLRKRLGEIAAPTLLLWATGERLLPPAAMLPYQERIPRCTRILIHGAAHELPIAAAPRWVALVADFVDRGEMFVVNLGDDAR